MNILEILNNKKITKKIEDKNKILRIIIYIICLIFTAISYNIFFVPNNIVLGGMGGLAIVIKEAFGLSTSVFLLISTVILLILSNILLGKEITKKNILCASLYPIFVTLIEPLTKNINIEFNSLIFLVLIAVITYAIPLGIIYKIGYNTGGGDIINQIIRKYKKTSVGQASNYVNLLIIFTSVFVLGIPLTIYSVFGLLLCNLIIDFIILGTSDSKLCIIKTKHIGYLEDFLQNEFNIGYSLLETKGGVDPKKRKTIMCIVSSREYFRFRNLILDIDPNAFFVTHDCYEVLGGNSKRIKI